MRSVACPSRYTTNPAFMHRRRCRLVNSLALHVQASQLSASLAPFPRPMRSPRPPPRPCSVPSRCCPPTRSPCATRRRATRRRWGVLGGGRKGGERVSGVASTIARMSGPCCCRAALGAALHRRPPRAMWHVAWGTWRVWGGGRWGVGRWEVGGGSYWCGLAGDGDGERCAATDQCGRGGGVDGALPTNRCGRVRWCCVPHVTAPCTHCAHCHPGHSPLPRAVQGPRSAHACRGQDVGTTHQQLHRRAHTGVDGRLTCPPLPPPHSCRAPPSPSCCPSTCPPACGWARHCRTGSCTATCGGRSSAGWPHGRRRRSWSRPGGVEGGWKGNRRAAKY